MATWLNEELPEEWPTAGTAKHTDSFSSAGEPSALDHLDRTVAIQASPAKTPQWKQVLSPRRSHHGNVDHLVGLFNQSSDTSTRQAKDPRPEPEISRRSMDTRDDSQDTTSSSAEQSDLPHDRRLKVFGNPDTFTNERLDGLLTSLQGSGPPGHESHEQSGPDTFSDRTDLAKNFLDIGEGLLKRIRKTSMLDLNQKQTQHHPEDTSLDDLERKLAQPNSTIDTTASSTNGSTLSSLHPTRNSIVLPPPQDQRNLHQHQRTGSLTSAYSSSRRSVTSRTSSRSSGSNRSNGGASPSINRNAYPSSSTQWSANDISHIQSPKKVVTRPVNSTVRFQSPMRGSTASELTQTTSTVYSRVPKARSNDMLQDVRSLAIAGYSDTETDSVEYNLETRPSMAMIRERASATALDNQTLSTTASDRGPPFTETTFSGRESIATTERDSSVRHSPLVRPTTSASYRKPSDITPKRADRTKSAPVLRSTMEEAFEVSRFPEESLHEPPLPGNLSTTSIGQRNTTFSGTMLELAHLLADYRDLDKVLELDFSDKELECVKGLDALVPNVSNLLLARNSIKVLEGLPTSLLSLDLSYNSLDRMSTFPQSFITRLDISHNELEDLRGLRQLRALTRLDISHNKLTSVKGIEYLHALEELKVGNNDLVELDISHHRLKVLDASDNKIRAARLSTPNLKELTLDNNQLVTLDAMPHLQVLSVRNNWASIDFTGWDSLTELYYDGNDVARNMQKISPRVLSWQGTEMTGFDAACLRNAQVAVLAGPGLDITSFISTVLPLQQLDLLNASLDRLPAWLPSKLPALSQLNLSFNNLDDQSLPVISGFKALRKLSVYRNKISDLKSVVKTLSSLPDLGAVDLRENPVSAGSYPSISLNTNQPPTLVYNDLLRSDWQNIDEQWLQTASDIALKCRNDYVKPMKSLGLWWLDGNALDGQHDEHVLQATKNAFTGIGDRKKLHSVRPLPSPAPAAAAGKEQLNTNLSAFGISTPQAAPVTLPFVTPSRPSRTMESRGAPDTVMRPQKFVENVSMDASEASALHDTIMESMKDPKNLKNPEYIEALADLLIYMFKLSYEKQKPSKLRSTGRN